MADRHPRRQPAGARDRRRRAGRQLLHPPRALGRAGSQDRLQHRFGQLADGPPCRGAAGHLPVDLGISWFWLLGATFLAQFPAFAKNVLGGNDHVVTLFLTAFSIGIGIGSMLCNRLLKGVISVRYVPAAALAMTVFILDLYFATRHLSADKGRCSTCRPFLPVLWPGVCSSTCCCFPWPAASLSCRSIP
jgi:hypothetical protein